MKLTVGIPFFNDEATLAQAIRSVFAQTFHDWELLLVDDAAEALDHAECVVIGTDVADSVDLSGFDGIVIDLRKDLVVAEVLEPTAQ